VPLTTKHILWECKETTRERRETGTTKEVWTDGIEGVKRLTEYTKKIVLFHGILTRTTCGRSRTNHKELQREEYKWTRILIKKEKKKRKIKCKLLTQILVVNVPCLRKTTIPFQSTYTSDRIKPLCDVEGDEDG
jgi:hypothetical protein